ncbi:hypothetical protein E2C01_063315 [Portunus trituberculatus]|uniref:Uncharacterized protein n=1 Tax=Portunus trituberculatus TaxID=210409 RepID=A0A5B7HA50_PORTR|nr:hypothetical protein [Portunus trituberculatus]
MHTVCSQDKSVWERPECCAELEQHACDHAKLIRPFHSSPTFTPHASILPSPPLPHLLLPSLARASRLPKRASFLPKHQRGRQEDTLHAFQSTLNYLRGSPTLQTRGEPQSDSSELSNPQDAACVEFPRR